MDLNINKLVNLFILAISQFFCLSLWFSTNAILPHITQVLNLTNQDIANISAAVVLGFVTGGFVSSITNISDIIPSTQLFFVASLFGSISNTIITLTSQINLILLSRFFTGLFLAGIYPIGMKLTASHFKRNRGLAIGVLLSALTAGSGLPYLFNLTAVPNWRILVYLSSALAIGGGLLVFIFCAEGPFGGKSPQFSVTNIKKIYSKASVRQANYGYFGHMWELYAFWVWIPIFLEESYSNTYPEANPINFVSKITFFIFIVGAISNIVGGYIADKIGRTLFNIVMLTVSGLSSILIGVFFDNLSIVIFIAMIWGLTIIPDSPQYSSMVTELADGDLIGSALTIQTAIGFTITMISIRIIPLLLEYLSWKWVFTSLAIGPVVGIIAMVRLRGNPDSIQIANGKR